MEGNGTPAGCGGPDVSVCDSCSLSAAIAMKRNGRGSGAELSIVDECEVSWDTNEYGLYSCAPYRMRHLMLDLLHMTKHEGSSTQHHTASFLVRHCPIPSFQSSLIRLSRRPMIRPQAGRPSVPGSRLAAWLVLSLCLAAAAVVLRDLTSLGFLLRRPAQCELDNEVLSADSSCATLRKLWWERENVPLGSKACAWPSSADKSLADTQEYFVMSLHSQQQQQKKQHKAEYQYL